MIIKRTLIRDMSDRSLIVVNLELRIADEGERFVNGLSPAFSATCEVYEARANATGRARQRMGRDADSGGADRKTILWAFPALKPIVDLHLSDPDGTPMHAEANGWYFYTGSRSDVEGGWTPDVSTDWRMRERGLDPENADHVRRYSYLMARDLLRVDEIPLADVEPDQLGDAFHNFVLDQRERWREEAQAARELLESLPEGEER